MSPDLCFLISIVVGVDLFKFALKIDGNRLGEDAIKYPLEPENRERYLACLPPHAIRGATVVAVEEIYEVVDLH